MSKKGDMKKIMAEKAHALRNPMSVIFGFLDAIESNEMTTDQQEFYKAARASMGRLVKITEEMSEIAHGSDKTGSEKTEPVKEPQTEFATRSARFEGDEVLVVDDDQEMQVQWRQTLQRIKLNPTEADCAESLIRMDLDYTRFRAAVVDYEFENSSLNGFDVIEFLKRKGVENIFLCTGLYNNPVIREEARKLGVLQVISKPIPGDVAGLFSC